MVLDGSPTIGQRTVGQRTVGQRTVGQRTVGQRAEQATAGTGTITFVEEAGSPERVSWAQLHEESRAVAAVLQSRGLQPGDHVALLGRTSRPLVTTIQATWLAGGATIILPLPMRLGSIDEFVSQTRARIESADAAFVIADPELGAFIGPWHGAPPLVPPDELAPGPGRSRSSDFESVPVDPASLAIIQFTSGSTADPKGVMLPHAAVLANLDGIASAAEFDPSAEVVMSWLPLYHDMGLIGTLATPMTSGADLVLASPQDFMASPQRWMEWMSEFGGTVTAGPNFSYALAARALRRHSDLDLSPLRLALNGAEPISPDVVEDFCNAGRPHGLDPGSMFCAFGMAEATLAVTFPKPGGGMSTDTVDRRALEHENCAVPVSRGDRRCRRLARLGWAIQGLEVRIVDRKDQTPCSEREVGELQIRGNSVMTGYYKHPRASDEAFHDGWLRTGDLGYMAEGELVVCGRAKDVIIVGGRNVFPEDVEHAVASVPGVRKGNVVAFGVEGRRGRERLVVVAETRDADANQVRRAVAERVRESVGLTLEDLVLLGPGTIPKTSSGKLQRWLCRSRYLASGLEPA